MVLWGMMQSEESIYLDSLLPVKDVRNRIKNHDQKKMGESLLPQNHHAIRGFIIMETGEVQAGLMADGIMKTECSRLTMRVESQKISATNATKTMITVSPRVLQVKTALALRIKRKPATASKNAITNSLIVFVTLA